jgi:hypothetical protein
LNTFFSAKGAASFIAGQLISHPSLDLNIPDVFKIFAVFGATMATVFYLLYLIVGRNLERKLVAELASSVTETPPQIEEFIKGYTPAIAVDPYSMTPL